MPTAKFRRAGVRGAFCAPAVPQVSDSFAGQLARPRCR